MLSIYAVRVANAVTTFGLAESATPSAGCVIAVQRSRKADHGFMVRYGNVSLSGTVSTKEDLYKLVVKTKYLSACRRESKQTG